MRFVRMVFPSTLPARLIVVADAAPLLRCGLRHTLATAFATYEVREAPTMPELLAQLASQLPALVVLAPNLPGAPPDALALLAALRRAQQQVSVLILADLTLVPERVQLGLLRHNVSGLLPHTAPLTEVCTTVGTVLAQGRCYTEALLALLQGRHRPPAAQTAGFSTRQLEVLHLVAQDFTNEEIADYLCTSVRTVEYHRSQMLQKAGARTTLGLVLFAQRRGLLAPLQAGAAPATPPSATTGTQKTSAGTNTASKPLT